MSGAQTVELGGVGAPDAVHVGGGQMREQGSDSVATGLVGVIAGAGQQLGTRAGVGRAGLSVVTMPGIQPWSPCPDSYKSVADFVAGTDRIAFMQQRLAERVSEQYEL